MIKTKFIEGTDRDDLERKLNQALEQIESEPKIKYFESRWMAVIEETIEEAYKKRLCCECAFWDDQGNSESLNAFCTMTGKRMRFNCKACRRFKDLRD